MAHLVKPRLKPQKWLLEHVYRRIPSDTLLSREDELSAARAVLALEEERNHRRSQIFEFYQAKDRMARMAYERGRRRYKTRLIIETILSLAAWKINIKKESKSIEYIAKKIAANILADHTMADHLPSQHDNLEKALFDTLSWHLTIPDTLVLPLRDRYQELVGHFEPLCIFRSHGQEDMGWLIICAFDSSFSIDFSLQDIDKILATVQKQLPSVTKTV